MVIFLGRSNVGKSSLINRLLGARGLARTSSRPGRTQSINVYRVNGWLRFVDLPGYGYARVPEAVRQTWSPMVERFLEDYRGCIALAVVVVDARRRPTELDGVMEQWLVERSVPYVVAATKTDKLSASERARGGHGSRGEPPFAVSATQGLGCSALWSRIDAALAGVSSTGRVR